MITPFKDIRDAITIIVDFDLYGNRDFKLPFPVSYDFFCKYFLCLPFLIKSPFELSLISEQANIVDCRFIPVFVNEC